MFFSATDAIHADEWIRSLTNGQCSTLECMNSYNIKSFTNGECSTLECMNRYSIRSLTNGACSTLDCMTRYNGSALRSPNAYTVPRSSGSGYEYGGRRSYNYDVSGYGDRGYISGNIDASQGSKYVDGYIQRDDGTEVYFDGEWTGKGEIEGYDEDGNYYELEVD